MILAEVTLAHNSGFPVEELAPLAGGAGSLFVVRAWLAIRIRARMPGR